MATITVKDTNANTLVSNTPKTKIDLPDQAATVTEVNLEGSSVVSTSRSGDDLVLELSNGKKIVLKDYFIELAGDLRHRLLIDEGEGLVEVSFGEAPTVAPSESNTSSGEAVTTSAIVGPGLSTLAGLLGIGAAGAAA